MDLRDVIDDLRKRIYDLERNQTRGSDTITVVGTALGVEPPTTGATTNPCRPRTSATLHEATIELDAAATADVTFDFLKSGSSIGSVTCPTGESDVTGTIEVGFSRGDQHKVQATDPGTGYQSFTIHEVWHTTRDWWHPPVMMFAAGALSTFALDTNDESGTFGSITLDVDIPTGTNTVTVTFAAVGGGFTLNTIHWENDPTGSGTPFASAFPGTPGPADAASTDDWTPGGTFSILLRAVSSDATLGALVSYSIAIS